MNASLAGENLMGSRDVYEKIISRKVNKHLKWCDVAAKMGLSKEWVTAACLGQMKLSYEQAAMVGEILISLKRKDSG